MPKHTPGDWTAAGSTVRTGAMWNATIVARCPAVNVVGQSLANADLMAAAPDLLAACEYLVYACEKAPPADLIANISEANKRAKAAIAKSKGETNA